MSFQKSCASSFDKLSEWSEQSIAPTRRGFGQDERNPVRRSWFDRLTMSGFERICAA